MRHPTAHRSRAARRVLPTVALAALAVGACSHDGREMREPVFPAPETTTTTLAPPRAGTG